MLKPFRVQNGIQFPDGTIQTSASQTSIEVSNYVLVNNDGGVFGSNDGLTWSGPFDTGLLGIERVAVGPNKVVYIADASGSEDGLYYADSWNSIPTQVIDDNNNQSNWTQVRYFNNIQKFVVVGRIGNTPSYKYSSDGVLWTTVSLDDGWGATLDNGAGYGNASFTDIATNGSGFLLTTENSILGSFYVPSITTVSSIGASEWLNDGMQLREVVFVSAGLFTGWHGFGSGPEVQSEDAWWVNSSFDPADGTFSNGWGIADVSLVIKESVGYEPMLSEVIVGRYNSIDTIMISTIDGQILYWPAVPIGPWVSIPKPYTTTAVTISNTNPAIATFPSEAPRPGEKIIISNATPSDYNGTYWMQQDSLNQWVLYTDSAYGTALDASTFSPFVGGTVTFSRGMYIDALNYANDKFYAANDSEEVFVSSNGGETWTQVATLSNSPGEGGDGQGTGTEYMSDIDAFVGTTGGNAANTGDITFNGVQIRGKSIPFYTGAIDLVPAVSANDGGYQHNFLQNGQYIRIYPTNLYDAPHIHITAGPASGQTWTKGDLFLGDDSSHVQVNGIGDVSIQSYNANTADTHMWYFSRTGSLTLPGTLVESTTYKTGGALENKTPLDVTKGVNKLTDGYYTLEGGLEGQIMYLVQQTGATGTARVYVNNCRINGVEYANNYIEPFINQQNMVQLLYTDGAWQSIGGQWD